MLACDSMNRSAASRRRTKSMADCRWGGMAAQLQLALGARIALSDHARLQRATVRARELQLTSAQCGGPEAVAQKRRGLQPADEDNEEEGVTTRRMMTMMMMMMMVMMMMMMMMLLVMLMMMMMTAVGCHSCFHATNVHALSSACAAQ